MLSLAELFSFLRAREVSFEVGQFSKEFFIVNVGKVAEAMPIADLGGTLKIGSVFAGFATHMVKEAFLGKDKKVQEEIRSGVTAPNSLVNSMFWSASGKNVFGVSVYCAEESLHRVSKSIQRFVGSAVKRELAVHGKRASFMGFSRSRKYPQLSPVEVLKKRMVENKAEILFCIGKKQTLAATTIAVHDPFEFQKRDVGKPKQRKIFAMPPRLARIMVNLASCTAGKVLLDPFCGVGTILLEALLSKARVIGVDVNSWCVQASKENLQWLKSVYALKGAEYSVLQGDARKLEGKIAEEVDCVVTEPDLGPALRHVATASYAARIIGKLEPLYYDFLQEMYRVLKRGGRLVLVTPFIQVRSGKPVTMPIEEKALDVGFQRVCPFRREDFAEDSNALENLKRVTSFFDVEKRHKIGREIHIFQK